MPRLTNTNERPAQFWHHVNCLCNRVDTMHKFTWCCTRDVMTERIRDHRDWQAQKCLADHEQLEEVIVGLVVPALQAFLWITSEVVEFLNVVENTIVKIPALNPITVFEQVV